jgi:hypothetical protein
VLDLETIVLLTRLSSLDTGEAFRCEELSNLDGRLLVGFDNERFRKVELVFVFSISGLTIYPGVLIVGVFSLFRSRIVGFAATAGFGLMIGGGVIPVASSFWLRAKTLTAGTGLGELEADELENLLVDVTSFGLFMGICLTFIEVAFLASFSSSLVRIDQDEEGATDGCEEDRLSFVPCLGPPLFVLMATGLMIGSSRIST